jgi:hypothetical protein
MTQQMLEENKAIIIQKLKEEIMLPKDEYSNVSHLESNLSRALKREKEDVESRLNLQNRE